MASCNEDIASSNIIIIWRCSSILWGHRCRELCVAYHIELWDTQRLPLQLIDKYFHLSWEHARSFVMTFNWIYLDVLVIYQISSRIQSGFQSRMPLMIRTLPEDDVLLLFCRLLLLKWRVTWDPLWMAAAVKRIRYSLWWKLTVRWVVHKHKLFELPAFWPGTLSQLSAMFRAAQEGV